jgi:hypothetical protein
MSYLGERGVLVEFPDWHEKGRGKECRPKRIDERISETVLK